MPQSCDTKIIIWQNSLSEHASAEKAKVLSSFFKTGKGEYGEGDTFIGVTVPDNRKVSKAHYDEPLPVIEGMLNSPIHEFRLAGLLALVERYRKLRDDQSRRETVRFYLDNAHRANNWDLVDLSAPKILGEHLLLNPDSDRLDALSRSECMWLQRIAIVATYTLIKHDRFEDTLRLAKRYLAHKHQLMHKATGWMLREIGKRRESTLIDFLDANAALMPRTALRYSIEKLSPTLKAHYMSAGK